MCSSLGGASRLTVRVAPPALREGHPTSAFPAGYLVPVPVDMYTRSQVAAEKGIVEAIHKLAIMPSFAYILPTNKA